MRRESLSLFEAAQATLGSLRDVQDMLRRDTKSLQTAASASAEQLTHAGAALGEKTASVTALAERLGGVSGEFGSKASLSLEALRTALARVEEVGSGLETKTAAAAAAGQSAAERAERSAEAVQAGATALARAASLLDARRQDIEKAGESVAGEAKIMSERLTEGAGILDARTAGLAAAGGKLLLQSGDLARLGHDHVAALNVAAEGLGRKTREVQDGLAGGIARIEEITGQFDGVSDEFGARAAAALAALGAALARVEEVGTGLEAKADSAASAGQVAAERAERGADSIRTGLAALTEVTALLETRRESLQRTGDAVNGEVRALNTQLEDGAGILEARARGLTEASAKLLLHSEDLARVGNQHVAELNGAAEGLVRKTREVQDGFAGGIARIGDISAEVTWKMDEATARIGTSLEGMRQTVGEATGSLDRFGEAGSRLARHREELDAMLTAVLGRMDALAGRFDGQKTSAGDAERALTQAGQKLTEALAQIRAEQEAVSREMETVGERSHSVSVRLEGLRTAAVSGVADLITEADRLQKRSEMLTDELKGQSGVLGDAIGRAGDIAEMLRATGTVVNDAVGKVGEASQKIRGELHDVGREIDREGGRLEKRAETAAVTLVGARAKLEETVTHIDGILGGLDRRAGEINFAVASSLSRLGELSHGLERARSEAAGSSDAVSSQMGATADALRASIDRIRETADEITGASALASEAGDKLVVTGTVLRDRVREITSSAGDANETIRRSAEDLSHSAGRTRTELEAIARQVRSENEAIAGTLTRIADVDGALRSAGAMVEEIVGRAAKSAESVKADLHAVGREIGVQSKLLFDTSASNGNVLGRTREQMETVVGEVQEAFTNLNRKAAEINFVVSTAVNRLGELSRGMEDAQASIDTASGSVSDRMTSVAMTLRAEFGGVNEVASRALERLERTLTSIAATSANAEAETQRAEQRMLATFEVVERSGTGFSDAVNTAIGNFERAEQALVQGQGRLTGNAESATGHLLRLARELASGGFDLGNTATATADRIAAASALVETRLQAINAISDAMRGALTAFATELGEVSEQSGTVTQALSDRGHILRDNIVQIVRTADDAGETLKGSATSLLASVTDISDAASRTRTEIVRATTQLREEASAVLETEAESRNLMAQVSTLLGDKAMEMATAARQVASETVTMREAHARMQRDLFLSAARTVLEGLRSLSVDLSRVLDRELPEELRQELARGDIQAFVQRLAAMRDQVPAAQLRAKFSADGTFRVHVQAYLAKFEELLTQAMQVDQGEVLTSTLMSSDVGKIYYFLTAAIGSDRDSVRQAG